MKGFIFSHVIFIDINFNFWKFQLFYSTTPMNLRLFLFIVDWLWSLSILSISIHYPILFNYQSCLCYAILYIMSIFYHFYTFIFILSILSIVFNSIHVYVHFHIFYHFCPFLFVLSILSSLSKFVVSYYLFMVHYCPSLIH